MGRDKGRFSRAAVRRPRSTSAGAVPLPVSPLLLSALAALLLAAYSTLTPLYAEVGAPPSFEPPADAPLVFVLPDDFGSEQGYRNWYYFMSGSPGDYRPLTWSTSVAPWGDQGVGSWNAGGKDPQYLQIAGPPSSFIQPGQGWSGDLANTAIGWRAPSAGIIDVSGTLWAGGMPPSDDPTDDGMEFSIYRGGTRISGPTWVMHGTESRTRTLSAGGVEVQEGEMIYFYQDRRGSQDRDAVGYFFRVVYESTTVPTATPSPSSTPASTATPTRVATATPTPTPVPNLLSNPSLQSGATDSGDPSGWSLTAAARGSVRPDPAASRSGGQGLLLGSEGGYYVVYQDVPVSPGQRYQLTGWVNVGEMQGGYYRVNVTPLDANGLAVGGAVTQGYRQSSMGWLSLRLELLAPPGAARVRVELRSDGAWGTAYADDLNLSSLGSP